MKYFHEWDDTICLWGEMGPEKFKDFEEYLEELKIPNIDKLKEGIVDVFKFDVWNVDY